jgi:hypothetical protein
MNPRPFLLRGFRLLILQTCHVALPVSQKDRRVYEAVCPNGHRLQVPIEHAGMKLRCPACNAIFQLQLPNGASPAAAAPASGGPSAAASSAPSSAAAAPSSAANASASGEAGGRWSGTESAAQQPSAAPPPAPPPPSQTPLPSRPSAPASAPWSAPLVNEVHLVSHALLIVGLLLAITARGCESIAAKNVVRLQGQADLDQRLFDEERESSLLETQKRLDDPKISAALRTQLEKELQDKQTDFDKRRKELQNGAWRETANAATRAAGENRAGSYWREMLFVAGSILLAFGLGATALIGQGAERWVACGLLAIIVFSLYVGGMAWSSSLLPGR